MSELNSNLSIKQLEELLLEAKSQFFNTGNSNLTDEEYDYYEDLLKKKNPKSKVLKLIGSEIISEEKSNKVKLPYWMGSMNKYKTEKDIDSWKKKYKKDYIVSDKLDGVSGLLIIDADNKKSKEYKLYTRGNGEYGSDISHLTSYLNLPDINVFDKQKKYILRGELIMKKTVFQTKYAKQFSNGRNLVSGVVNSKKINEDILSDIDLIIYEIIYPEDIAYNLQLCELNKYNFNVVPHNNYEQFDYNDLKEHLKKRKELSEYEIDGIIIRHNDSYKPIKKDNPKFAFAFKQLDENNIKEVKVVDVLWNVSKHGYLKPRIEIEKTIIGDTIIQFVTGFNAKYIKDNKINIGSILKITRSGDVIPHILEVITKSSTPLLPNKSTYKYQWNETGIDIYLNESNQEQEIKQLVDIFKKLKTKGLSIGIITKLYNHGYNMFSKIINVNPIELNKLDGFQEKLSAKLYKSIQDSIKDIDLLTLMNISNVFGRGFGKKKLELILNQYPNIIELYETLDKKTLLEYMNKIDGFAEKTSNQFIAVLPKFIKFMNEVNITLTHSNQKKESIEIDKKTLEKYEYLKEKNIVMTGFRDNKLIEIIEKLQGKLQTTINKKTDIVLVKDIYLKNKKIEKATEMNISIIQV